MIANERLTIYVNEKLSKLNHISIDTFTDVALPKVKLIWTAKKAELVEQIYAWDSAGCFNNSKINIKELAESALLYVPFDGGGKSIFIRCIFLVIFHLSD